MSLKERITALLGSPVVRMRGLSGGDVSVVHAAWLEDGREVVAKSDPGARREADMLRAIAATGCPAAAVIAEMDGLIVMDRLAEGRPCSRGWAEAGAAIARLHAAHGSRYGWHADHAIGPAAQPQPFTDDWPDFWARHRLLAWPDALPADIRDRLETLAGRLPDLLPAQPPASLLHGDLWAGNLLFDPDEGFAGLIDPASYYGDAEVDLAALTTFGRPAPAFWEAYGPLRDGWDMRRPIYRLWIALLHLRLFGETYRRMVEGCLDAAEAA